MGSFFTITLNREAVDLTVSNLYKASDMNQESVEISPYNPEWPRMFACEKKILHEVADVWLMGSIEHIGSTSIPGLASKPVIDIMFGVQSLENSQPAIDVIVNSGYEYFPYKKDVMHWFCKPSHKHRTHHLHLVPFQSKLWNDQIQFREILLTNENIAEEYLNLKQELAKRYKYDREGYTEGKWPFIEQVLKRVGRA